MVDPDVPLEEEWFPFKEQLKVGILPGDLFIHWIICDVPASTTVLAEEVSPDKIPSGAKELVTSFGAKGYGGPAPPKGHKAHKYILTLYALSIDRLGLSPEAGYVDFINAIKGNVLATSSLTAYFGHY